MDASRLRALLTEYGADWVGIADRFMGDDELYAKCLESFLKEPNFALLGETMAAADYAAAFEPAHALKGVGANLGLTPFSEAVGVLVESLRAGDIRNVQAEYERVIAEYQRLSELVSDRPASAAPSAPAVAPPKPAAKPRALRRLNAMVLVMTGVLALVTLIVGYLFSGLTRDYRDNMQLGSSLHLEELTHQLRLYVEENIENDWKIAYSVANSLARDAQGGDEGIYVYMRNVRALWKVSNLILYTEDGMGVDADGVIMANDAASEVIYQARRYGEYSAIVRSTITYTIPVETELCLRGSPIAALSIVQNLETFLDDMNFSAFDNTAYIYLTQDTGTVISMLTHPEAAPTFNFISLLKGRELKQLSGSTGDEGELLTSQEPVTYLASDPAGARYIVSTPILTHHTPMRLFFLVPEKVVNATLDQFTDYVTALSAFVIIAFVLAATLVFLTLYRVRKREFNKALTGREHMFSLLVQNTSNAFALLSVKREAPLYVSPNTERILGQPYVGLCKDDTGYHMAVTEATPPAFAQVNRRLAQWSGRSVFVSDYLPLSVMGLTRYFTLSLYPEEENPDEFVGILQDVTPQHDRESAVKDALEMAERANEAKSSFLSNMSHDIRTPMNAIVNMTDFAIESVGDPKRQRGFLQTIRESSEHLLHLINDVLDKSRIDSGRMTISSEPFDPLQELQSLSHILRPLCEARKQVFITDFDRVPEESLLGDRMKVSQVLMNLLSNAVKFTPEHGAIRFTAERLPALRPDVAEYRFTVEDNGMGISEKDRERIFEPFARVDDRRVSGIEGTGLGLSICRSYVSAMGGKLTCESEEGNGSTFTVELAFRRADAAPAAPRRPVADWGETPFLGKRCLLCEDNATNRVIARMILERVGFMVEEADDGGEAMSRFLASRPGYFDVIFMDIQMPVLDGYQATVAIRDSGHPMARSIPIVAMTANVFAEDIEKARIAGMNGHLGKPLNTMELIEVTHRVLNETEES